MNRVLVRYLLWFFIAALPLQGYAGVMRMCCGQGMAATPAMPSQQHDTAPASPAMAHCAGMMAMGSNGHGHEQDQAAPAAADHGPQPGADHGCAACAACCLAAALLPSASPQFDAAQRNARAVALTPAVFLAGHIPAGLERPPRFFLA